MGGEDTPGRRAAGGRAGWQAAARARRCSRPLPRVLPPPPQARDELIDSVCRREMGVYTQVGLGPAWGSHDGLDAQPWRQASRCTACLEAQNATHCSTTCPATPTFAPPADFCHHRRHRQAGAHCEPLQVRQAAGWVAAWVAGNCKLHMPLVAAVQPRSTRQLATGKRRCTWLPPPPPHPAPCSLARQVAAQAPGGAEGHLGHLPARLARASAAVHHVLQHHQDAAGRGAGLQGAAWRCAGVQRRMHLLAGCRGDGFLVLAASSSAAASRAGILTRCPCPWPHMTACTGGGAALPGGQPAQGCGGHQHL